MKAPTADYSPLSQALSAKNSAIQSGYAAKDAANWKSRYQIQEKNLGLQREALADSRAQNNINLGINLANTYLNYKSQKDKLDQDNENLKANQGWSLYGQEADTIIAKYGDQAFTEGKTVEYGPNGREEKTFTQVNPQMEQELNAKFDEIFGSESDWSKKAWSSIQTNKQMASSAIQESMWQNYNKRVSQQNTNLFNTQYAGLMTEAYQSGTSPMVSFSYSDGNGGTVTKSIPASVNNLINNMNSYNEAEKQTLKIAAAGDYENGRGAYLVSSISDMVSTGSFMQDTSALSDALTQLTQHEDSITDKQAQSDFHKQAQYAISNALSTFSNNQLKIIADNGNRADDVSAFLKELEDGGQLYGLFFDTEGNRHDYVSEGTYSTIKASVQGVEANLEKLYGTTDTAALQQNLKGIIDDPYQTPMQFSTRIDSAMTASYGKDWKLNTEARSVYMEAMKSMLPKDQDWTKHEGFSNAFKNALTTIMDKPGYTLDTLYEESPESYWAGLAVQDQMLAEIYDAVIENPGLLRDPVQLAQQLDSISSQFTSKFFDAIKDNVNLNDAPETSAEWLVSNAGEDYAFIGVADIDENGFLKPNARFASGFYSQYSNALQNVGTGINLKPGMNVDINSGSIKYEVDKEGNLVPKYARFNEVGADGKNTNSFINYDLKTGRIEREKIAMPDAVNDPGAGPDDMPTEFEPTGSITKKSSMYGTPSGNKEVQKTLQEGYSVEGRANEILGMTDKTPLEKLEECPTIEVLNAVYGSFENPTKAMKDKYNEMRDFLYEAENTPEEYLSDVDAVKQSIGADAAKLYESIENEEAKALIEQNRDTPAHQALQIAREATSEEAFNAVLDFYRKVDPTTVSQIDSEAIAKARDEVRKKSPDSYYTVAGYGHREGYRPPNAPDTREDIEGVIEDLGKTNSNISNAAYSLTKLTSLEKLEMKWGQMQKANIWKNATPEEQKSLKKVHDYMVKELGGTVEDESVPAQGEATVGSKAEAPSERAGSNETALNGPDDIADEFSSERTDWRTMADNFSRKADMDLQNAKNEFKKTAGLDLPDDINSTFDSIGDSADAKFASLMFLVDDIDTLESMWKELTGMGVWAYDAYKKELKTIYDWKKSQLSK